MNDRGLNGGHGVRKDQAQMEDEKCHHPGDPTVTPLVTNVVQPWCLNRHHPGDPTVTQKTPLRTPLNTSFQEKMY